MERSNFLLGRFAAPDVAGADSCWLSEDASATA
jgi:hypothetical protein